MTTRYQSITALHEAASDQDTRVAQTKEVLEYLLEIKVLVMI